jgi:uncharacterized glyoxalase superfamily protein PhnB
VDDLDAVHRKLQEGGFPVSEIEDTHFDAREFFVQDPDGYELWVSQPGEGSG